MQYFRIIILVFILLTSCNANTGDAFPFRNEDLSESTKTAPYSLSIEIYYIPRLIHLPPRKDIKEAAEIVVKYNGQYWQEPLVKLQEIGPLKKYNPVAEPVGWLSEIIIKNRDQKNQTTYFTIQLADFAEIIVINGTYYKTNPEILNWYKTYIMPILNSINHGVVHFDDLDLKSNNK